VAVWRCSNALNWRAAIAVAALAGGVSVMVPSTAGAQGFFDFLFGGSQRPPPSTPQPPPPSTGIGRVAPAPLGQERVNEGAGSTGHGVAFCVRLCDGQHFPMEQMASATPADTCRAICPNSDTKVFFGAEIAGAVARGGARYSELRTAFLYRKQLVANCTCNGRDPLGLAPLDVKADPTLRPGDIVSTKDGLQTYSGKGGQSSFTPVNPSALGPQLNSVATPQRTAPAAAAAPPQQELQDEPGTIVRPQAPPPGPPRR
jgi:hypothetical protein